jgi:hypothetical protein
MSVSTIFLPPVVYILKPKNIALHEQHELGVYLMDNEQVGLLFTDLEAANRYMYVNGISDNRVTACGTSDLVMMSRRLKAEGTVKSYLIDVFTRKTEAREISVEALCDIHIPEDDRHKNVDDEMKELDEAGKLDANLSS